MMNVRPQSVDRPAPSRFNVLLTEDDRPRPTEHWINQLPRLLQPQGVTAYVARSGQEAINLAGRLQIHAAVIDLSTPRGSAEHDAPAPSSGSPGGLWLLELFRRLPNRPPVVVINHRAYSERQVDRFLREALRLGAFSVLNRPVDLEQLLAVFRRVVDRQYRGAWPVGPDRTTSDS